MRAASAALRLRSLADRSPAPDQLAGRAYPEAARPPRALLSEYRLEELEIGGRPVLRLTPHGPASGEHLLYTHGGSYLHPLSSPHWWVLRRVLHRSGVTLVLPLYRLAPEGNAEEAHAFLRQVYEQTSAAAGGAARVTLSGDSAGGGLALAQALQHRDLGLPPSRQVVLLAPWLDLTLSHPDVPRLARRDTMLDVDRLRAAGRLWAGALDPHDPRVSPAFGELAGLPPVHVLQGGRDVLAGDAWSVADRLRVLGNGGTFTFEPDGFHVYPVAVWTPEGRRAVARIRALLAR
jgi:monoterpene epsilon-lactone hydrolase